MRKILLMVSFGLASIASTLAQGITTASISGAVYDAKAESLPGATVIAVHEPSGAQYGTTTRVDGRFTIPNARVGGPYKVTVTYVGFETQVKSDVYLSLGNSTNVDFTLIESGTQLQEIQI